MSDEFLFDMFYLPCQPVDQSIGLQGGVDRDHADYPCVANKPLMGRNRMRRRLTFKVLVMVAVTVVCAYGVAFWYSYRSFGADVRLVKQATNGGSVMIVLKATNKGRVPLIYHGSPPFRTVRVDLGSGWTDLPQAYSSKMASFGWILPEESLTYFVSVPIEARHVQVTCFFTTAGARSRVAAWLVKTDWGWHFLRMLRWLLPDGPAKEVEFVSPVVALTGSQ